MKNISHQTFDEERALYGEKNLSISHCAFDGLADGESAFKECTDISVENCFFNLRYPFWHDHNLKIADSEITELCRAALWYTDHLEISGSKIHGIKALRECRHIKIRDCDVISHEFGWSAIDILLENTTAVSEYFMMRSKQLVFRNVQLNGKYSFQYIKNATFEDCIFDTKDAFWHAENVVVRNSIVRGEYLAWYSDNVTFENCKIIGTQPMCYCRSLKLIDCEMIDTDLCFERSDVQATITTPIVSIKNLISGTISVPSVGKVIRDISEASGKIIIQENLSQQTSA